MFVTSRKISEGLLVDLRMLQGARLVLHLRYGVERSIDGMCVGEIDDIKMADVIKLK